MRLNGSDINIFPNPFNETAKIIIPENSGALAELSIEIIDVSGRSIKLFGGLSSYTMGIDRSGMANGLYFTR